MRAALLALALAALPAAAPAQSETAASVTALPASVPYIRASYGFGPIEVGELRLPPGKGPFPVAIVIHGGCWTKGMATLRMTAPMADALTARGFATWNIEYLQIGDDGGGWPGTFEDWAMAADHLRVLAKTEPLDLTRVIAVGHAAGGHAALWLAARARLSGKLHGDDPVPIKAVVDIDGPADLLAFIPVQKDICPGRPAIDQLMGGTPETQAERFKDGNPAQRLPLHVATLLVASQGLPAADAEAYAAKARAAGDRVEILTLENAGHFDPIAPGTPAWARVEAFIVDQALKSPAAQR